MQRINLGTGNVVMVEANTLPRDKDYTFLYVGEIVKIQDTYATPIGWRTKYKNNPRRMRSRYLITMRVCDGSYLRFYDWEIKVFVVVKERV